MLDLRMSEIYKMSDEGRFLGPIVILLAEKAAKYELADVFAADFL